MLAQNVVVEQEGNMVVATVITPLLSLSESQDVVLELNERMRYNNAQLFILDMAEVTFMDSSCLGTLVQFLQDLGHIRGRLVLANCNENIAFLFKVTRLDDAMPLVESIEEAKELLKGH